MAQLPPNVPFDFPSFPSPSPSPPPSPSGISDECFQWVDELIDYSACTQTTHRRTFSDSIVAFKPLGAAAAAANPTILPVPPSNHNNVNINPPNCYVQPDKPIQNIHSEGENSSVDDVLKLPIQDPKRIKRILANRQSARRSRERKLQYISELQKCVGKLETEVAALTPRVAFFDCQRSMLVMQNSQLKQRIALLAQDSIIKDACQESLKREIGRLSQVLQRQNLTQTDPMMAAIDAGGEDLANIFSQNDLQTNP